MNPIRINKRHIVISSIVLALGTALSINYFFSPEKNIFSFKKNEEVPASTNIGDAIYVNSSNVDTDQKKDIDKIISYFHDKKIERNKNRENIIKMASNADTDVSNKIIKETRQELNIEDLIKSKLGSEIIDCIAIIGDDGCNFIVSSRSDHLKQNTVYIIKDIIQKQTGFKNDKIKIIEKN